MKTKLIWSLLVLVILFSSCVKPYFTDEEKRQARLFLEAKKADLQAIQISNSGQPFRLIKKEDIQEMLRLRKKALNIARTISDQALLKIHKNLPVEYSKYKEALSLIITNLEKGDIMAAIKGNMLHDNWVDWFNANKSEFKIPK